MKRFLLNLLFCAILLMCTVSCTNDLDEKEPNTDQSPLFRDVTVTKLEICDTFRATSLKAITDASSIASFKATFDGWNMEEHKVPANKIIDEGPPVYVIVTDSLTVSAFPVSNDPMIRDENGLIYGHVNGVPYYMPSAFSAWLYAQV